MDRFSELRAFIAVADAEGFSAAARSLGQSRSSVNRLVLALEERLGVQLLNRTTRAVSLTGVGRAVYDRAQLVLNDLEELEQSARTSRVEPIGKLRLSAPPTLGRPDFAEIVVEFMAQHPKVEVEAHFDSRLVDPVSEGFDVVIRASLPDEETTLVDHRVMSMDYALCAAPGYLDHHGAPSAVEELAAHKTLYLGIETVAPRWSLIVDGALRDVPVRPVMLSNDFHAILRAARAGLGIAVLPLVDIEGDLDTNRLVCVLPDVRPPPRVLQVIHPPTRHLSAKVRRFVDFVAEYCAEVEAGERR